MDTVRKLGFHENTLTMFASDHGPHVEICEEGGDQGPFRGTSSNYSVQLQVYGLHFDSVIWKYL